MPHGCVSKYLINTEEEIQYSLGIDEAKDELSSSTLILTKNYLYIIGSFLFRENKTSFTETNGLKVVDIKSVSSITEIKKKYPILFLLFVIFLIVGIVLFSISQNIPSLELNSSPFTSLFLIFIALIFLVVYFLFTERMLLVEFFGGDLMYELSKHKADVSLEIIKIIFNNKN